MHRPKISIFNRYLILCATLSIVFLCGVFEDHCFAELSDQILSIGTGIQYPGGQRTIPLIQEFNEGGIHTKEQLMPGSISLKPLTEDRIRLASIGSNSLVNNSSALLDAKGHLEQVGKRVGQPLDLYSRFQIEVERSSYNVKLFGCDDEGKKDLLFSCKAGLGSPEYPTPRGTFYILRIFDNHPLWIPPDREWAYGQSPSRSVYGGHMMPFFSKVQAFKLPVNDDLETETDAVAPPMKMVDMGAYRIHGTDSPWSVGSAQSHGCVRLVNSSVAQLADTLKMYVGTTTRGENPNGVFINLARPVKITLY
ncbi:MAG: L,D-transpeptidase [Pseudomonadota bacterium]